MTRRNNKVKIEYLSASLCVGSFYTLIAYSFDLDPKLDERIIVASILSYECMIRNCKTAKAFLCLCVLKFLQLVVENSKEMTNFLPFFIVMMAD